MPKNLLPPLPTDAFECLCQGCERPWEVATAPFKVTPDTYYVGNNWVGAYLLTSDDGLALIDTTMQPQVYLVLESIRMLGFDPADIRKILISHMHYDHVGGVRALAEHTGAKVLMSREDWTFMNQKPDQIFTAGYPFGRFTPDGFFDDDNPVHLGQRRIRTVLSPGHTPGTTSFFFESVGGDGRPALCGMHGGVGLNTLTEAGLKASGQPASTREDFLHSLLALRQIPVDITLGSHPKQVGMMEKIDLMRPGHNPFQDPKIWHQLIDGRIAQIRALMEMTA
ncbi:MBL fold metallo-hydrolase [Paracoccus liaowanqingii]|uniref:MBL fold metallo-hydrolase n=1 Tax=Paracoccus liaowanqingii TaxID=2560053 RepID=A0A4Z1CFW3_9RHOB|nr:MBL fold metallo-hydrolase [Paracoccus liaowanqingii]TGN56395.1 MBL fold metallo-hydrolase [Paracoccus liaowanqingii]